MHGEAAVNDPQPTDVGPVYPGKAIAVHHNRTPFRAADLLVPWELNKPTEVTGTINETKRTVFHRFYHVFREGELQLMCAKVPSCQVCSSYYENGNWCVVLRKTIEDSDKI